MNAKVAPSDDDGNTAGDKSLTSSNRSRHHDGSGIVVDERLAQTSKTLRYLLDGFRFPSNEAWSHTLFGCVLLADISGFTRLSTILNVEQLKHHINAFFTLLLSTVKRFGGDTVKFCGDAVIIIWTAPQGASDEERARLALTATNCGLAVIDTCGSYDKGTPSRPISLRLHCGLSAGPLHCMCLGDKQRMEFLVSGAQLREMGVAAGDAKMGELCVTSEVYDLLQNRFNATLTSNQNYLIIGETFRHRSSIVANRRTLKSVATAIQGALSLKRSEGATGSTRSLFSLRQASMYSIADSVGDDIESMSIYDGEDNVTISDDLLIPFVHECTRRSIQLQASDFLAEIRRVVTLFIELLDLNSAFDAGNCAKPQAAMMSILNVLRSLGGSLRQFVVDDKGCVVICSFGVPGFSYDNNELRAIFTAMGVRDGLQEHGIACRIGIASGNAYCGYVGSRDRKEYCIMGSSVNLAARLMGKAMKQEILVGESVHAPVSKIMEFAAMPPVNAKGYDHPINVFSVVKREMSLDNMRRSSLQTMTVLNRLICRSAEMSALRSHLIAFMSSTAAVCDTSVAVDTCNISPHTIGMPNLHNRRLVVAPEGFGKTLLIQHLMAEENGLLADALKANCHLADIDEVYSTVLGICRQVFNINQISQPPSAHEEDEVWEFDFENLNEQEGYMDILNHLRMLASSREFCDAYIYVRDSQTVAYSLANRSRSASASGVDDMDDSPTCSVVKIMDDEMRQRYLEREHVSLYSLVDAVNMLPGCIVNCRASALASYSMSRSMAIVRHALAHMLKTAIESSASRVLILEDLHWCDEASFDILRQMVYILKHGYFLGTMRPSNCTAVGRYSRADSMMSYADAKNYLENLKSMCDVIRIQPFTEMQVRVAVESTIEPCQQATLMPFFDEKCLSTIYRHSKGAPGAVFEIAEKLKNSVAIQNSNKIAGDHNVDGDIVHILDSLSLESQLVLKVAAVCGTKFSVEIVRKVLEQMECSDMSANVINAVMDIKRNHLVRRCMPIWDVPTRAILRAWGESNNMRRQPTSGKHTLVSVAKGIKAMVSVSKDARSQSVRDANCYAFTDKRIRESVYGVMLADQQKSMHAVIAAVMERDYVRGDVRSDTQLAILKFVAFHYSRAGNMEKDVYYSQLVASRLFVENMIDESIQYYHHLVEVATNRPDLGDVVKYVTNSYDQSRRRSSLLIGNANRQRVMSFRQTDIGEKLPKHYLPFSDFLKNLDSKCDLISNTQLCEYLQFMSVIEFRQNHFVLSDTYFKLAKKVKLHRCNATVWCIGGLSNRIRTSAVALFESVAAQADLCLMRGDVGTASRLLGYVKLRSLGDSDVAIAVQFAALSHTVSMLEGKNNSKEFHRMLAVTDNCSGFSRNEVSYINYHRGIQALINGDMKKARNFLNRIAHNDVTELLYMCSKHLLAWVFLFGGRINEALRTVEAAKRCVLDESPLYSIWESELRAVIAIMSGDFSSADCFIQDMLCKQRGRLGVVFYHAISASAGILQAFATTMNLGDMQQHIANLSRANVQLGKIERCGPLSITSMFLCAYTSIMLLQQTTAISENSDALRDFVVSLDQVIHRLRNISVVIPCVKVLVECLMLKATPNAAALKKIYHRWRWSCNVKRLVSEHEDGNSSIANYQFVFGGAFWRLELCRAFNITSISTIKASELEIFDRTWRCASRLFQRYGTDRDHPLLMFLVKKDPVETTDRITQL